MEKKIDFNSNQTVIITNEVVGGVLLDLRPFQADGTTVCNIADLNKIGVEITVSRKGQAGEKTIFNGYLDDYLSAIFAGTTGYDIAITKQAGGYLVPMPFMGALRLNDGDQLKVQVKAQTTSFTSLSNANSSIYIESIPSNANSNVIAIVDAIPYTPGDVTVKKTLGSGILKVVLAHDFSANYIASAKAKPLNGLTLAANGYLAEPSANMLLAQSLGYLSNNPSTTLKHVVAYNNRKPLNGATLSAKYDQGVDATAKILVVRQAVL